MARNEQPKSINLLQPVYTPTDTVSTVYSWLATVGKYLLIVVELVVLGVFFSRFIFDEKNNDLTIEIASQIDLLSDPTWKKNNITYTSYQSLLTDIEVVRMGQKLNSEIVSEVTNNIPVSLILNSFSLNGDRISLNLTALNLEDIRIYETALKANNRYSDVKFNIAKDDEKIMLSVSFNIVREIK